MEESGELRGNLPRPRSLSSIQCHSFLLTQNVDTLYKHSSIASIQRTSCCAPEKAGWVAHPHKCVKYNHPVNMPQSEQHRSKHQSATSRRIAFYHTQNYRMLYMWCAEGSTDLSR